MVLATRQCSSAFVWSLIFTDYLKRSYISSSVHFCIWTFGVIFFCMHAICLFRPINRQIEWKCNSLSESRWHLKEERVAHLYDKRRENKFWSFSATMLKFNVISPDLSMWPKTQISLVIQFSSQCRLKHLSEKKSVALTACKCLRRCKQTH